MNNPLNFVSGIIQHSMTLMGSIPRNHFQGTYPTFWHLKQLTELKYHKIPKISPTACIFQRLFLIEGLIFGGAYLRGNLCFKIDWASHIVGSKFTIFALFYLVFDGNFPSTSPQGAYNFYLEGWFNGGFFALSEGIIHGGAYFQNFTVILPKNFKKCEDFLTLHVLLLP